MHGLWLTALLLLFPKQAFACSLQFFSVPGTALFFGFLLTYILGMLIALALHILLKRKQQGKTLSDSFYPFAVTSAVICLALALLNIDGIFDGSAHLLASSLDPAEREFWSKTNCVGQIDYGRRDLITGLIFAPFWLWIFKRTLWPYEMWRHRLQNFASKVKAGPFRDAASRKYWVVAIALLTVWCAGDFYLRLNDSKRWQTHSPVQGFTVTQPTTIPDGFTKIDKNPESNKSKQ
jgi:hypothetical protein